MKLEFIKILIFFNILVSVAGCEMKNRTFCPQDKHRTEFYSVGDKHKAALSQNMSSVIFVSCESSAEGAQ